MVVVHAWSSCTSWIWIVTEHKCNIIYQCIVYTWTLCTHWTQHLLQCEHPADNSVTMSDILTTFINYSAIPLDRTVEQAWYVPQMPDTIGSGLHYCVNLRTCSVVEHYHMDRWKLRKPLDKLFGIDIKWNRHCVAFDWRRMSLRILRLPVWWRSWVSSTLTY